MTQQPSYQEIDDLIAQIRGALSPIEANLASYQDQLQVQGDENELHRRKLEQSANQLNESDLLKQASTKIATTRKKLDRLATDFHSYQDSIKFEKQQEGLRRSLKENATKGEKAKYASPTLELAPPTTATSKKGSAKTTTTANQRQHGEQTIDSELPLEIAPKSSKSSKQPETTPTSKSTQQSEPATKSKSTQQAVSSFQPENSTKSAKTASSKDKDNDKDKRRGSAVLQEIEIPVTTDTKAERSSPIISPQSEYTLPTQPSTLSSPFHPSSSSQNQSKLPQSQIQPNPLSSLTPVEPKSAHSPFSNPTTTVTCRTESTPNNFSLSSQQQPQPSNMLTNQLAAPFIPASRTQFTSQLTHLESNFTQSQINQLQSQHQLQINPQQHHQLQAQLLQAQHQQALFNTQQQQQQQQQQQHHLTQQQAQFIQNEQLIQSPFVQNQSPPPQFINTHQHQHVQPQSQAQFTHNVAFVAPHQQQQQQQQQQQHNFDQNQLNSIQFLANQQQHQLQQLQQQQQQLQQQHQQQLQQRAQFLAQQQQQQQQHQQIQLHSTSFLPQSQFVQMSTNHPSQFAQMNNNSSQAHFSSLNNTNQQQLSSNHQLTQPLFPQQTSPSLETFALKQLQAQPFLPGQNSFQ